jgi:hypothetical protein
LKKVNGKRSGLGLRPHLRNFNKDVKVTVRERYGNGHDEKVHGEMEKWNS